MVRAVARGEGLLYGPTYTPLLFGHDVPSPSQVASHLALALPAIFQDGAG